MALSDEEEKLVAAHEAREAEHGRWEDTEYGQSLMKAMGVTKMPTLRETFEEAATLYAAGVCNPIKHPDAPMRCSECGKSWGICDCTKSILRAFTCERCGLRVMTGGRGIGELLTVDEVVC